MTIDHEGRVRALRPHRQFVDRGDEHWRAGKVLSINGANATIRLLCDPGFVRDIAVTTASLPCASKGAQ